MSTVTFTAADVGSFLGEFVTGPTDVGAFVLGAPSDGGFGSLSMTGSGSDSTDPRFMGTTFLYRQSGLLDISALPVGALVSHVRIRVPSTLDLDMFATSVSDPSNAQYDITIGGINENGSGGTNPSVVDENFVHAGVGADTNFDFPGLSQLSRAAFQAMFENVTIDVECTTLSADGNTSTVSIDLALAVTGWEMEVTYSVEAGLGAVYAATEFGINKSNDAETWLLLTPLFNRLPSSFYPRGIMAFDGELWFSDSSEFAPQHVYRYDGGDPVIEDPPTAGVISEIMGFTHDTTNDRLYVLYYDDVNFDITRMAYWDGASWTSVDTSAILADGGLAFYSRMECLGDSVFLCVVSSNISDPSEVIVYRSDGGAAFVVDSVIPDLTFNADNAPSVMQQCGDELFLLWDNYDFGSGIPQQFVYKRDNLGVWTDVSPTAFGDFGEMSDAQFFGGEVYVTFNTVAVGGTEVKILKRDVDGIWSLEFDVEADDPGGEVGRIRDLAVFNSVLLGGAEDALGSLTWSYRQTAPGAWERFTIDGGAYFITGDAVSGPLTITLINPDVGDIAGGTEVEITGTGFDEDIEVLFDQLPAQTIVYNSSTSLTVTTPPHAEGFVDVTVTNPDDGEFVTEAGGFEYADIDSPLGTPTITGIVPDSGTMAGGTPVTISGSGFKQGSIVLFGGTPATSVVVALNGLTITCVTPAHPVGTYDVQVTG